MSCLTYSTQTLFFDGSALLEGLFERQRLLAKIEYYNQQDLSQVDIDEFEEFLDQLRVEIETVLSRQPANFWQYYLQRDVQLALCEFVEIDQRIRTLYDDFLGYFRMITE